MKASAAAVWRESSRVASRTRTFVSTARTAPFDVLPHTFLELCEGPRLGFLFEQSPMHVLRAVAPRSPDHDPLSILLPFQNGARTDAQPPADFFGDGDLALRGKPRECDCHALRVPR